ncbi:hypothetical protein EDB84DRAFT_1570395 [Lactarius hengduanensis]|nr:hypothetical protein EDB84DRAFT_1570395 [Lactarius hengduanensis]
MYYDDEDDDPYAPRIGPAAMPSPRSRLAPYFSGCADSLEDFLEEYEGLAYDRALTDPQRVDVIIRYVAPSLRDFWRSLNGYRSHDWPLFRHSLIDIFGNPTPRHQIMKQKLRSYVQDSSRRRMDFHAGHLSEEERDAAFWYGFHPEDRKVIQPRLLGKNPFQPPDIPFHFEDVFVCARAAFAYDGSSFWSHAKQFEPPSIRREHPVVEPNPRDPCRTLPVVSLDAIHPAPPFSSSPSAPESQHTQAPSVTLDQPEPARTFSTTLLPSSSPPSHTPSPVHSATDNDLIPAPTFPITTSTLLPSAFPILIHVSSLVHSAADGNPEILSTFPSPSITAPFSMPMSEFEHLPSGTVDQPAPTLSSTPPSSSISSTFLPSPARSAMNSQPESEHEAAPTSMSAPLLSLPLSTLHPLSPLSSTFLPSPVTSVTEEQPEPESEPASTSESPVSKFGLSPRTLSLPPDETLAPLLSSSTLSSSPLLDISTLDSLPVALSPDQSLLSGTLSQLSRSRELESSTPVSAADVVTLSHPESSLSSPGEPVPFLPASPEAPPIAHISPCSTPPQRLPEVKTISSVSTRLEVTPAPASLAIPFAPQSQELPTVNEVWSTLAPRFPLTSPPLTLSRSGLARFNFSLVLITTTVLVSTLFNASTTLSILAHKYWNKNEDFGNIQIGTLNTSSRDVFAQRLRLGHPTPRGTRFVFDPGGVFKFKRSSSRLPSAHEDVRKRMPKTRNGFITHVAIPVPVPIDNLVFDPGGQSPSSSVQVQDYFRHTKTFASASRGHASPSLAARSTPAIPIPILVDNLTVFDPGGVAFESEPAHEDLAMFDEDARRLCLRASILDAVLTCIGERISAILLDSADKDEKYIASLHNELAAVWVIGLLSSSGSSPHVPEPVRIAFHSFSDIRNPGTYATHNGNQKPKGKIQASAIPRFNFTEWWKIGEGVAMKEPFDVRDELVPGLLHALEMEAGSRLRASVTEGLKQARQLSKNIESCRNSMYRMLHDARYSFEAEAIRLEDENSG